jgi:hypothetical protein
LRYGIAEQLYGYRRIAAFRAARPAIDLRRELLKARDHHLRPRLRHRELRIPPHRDRPPRPPDADLGAHADGWQVVAAHVSLLPA